MGKGRRNAFTLIEVLIVVIIMAVLAATIIPQFTSSTKDAKMSTVKFDLHTIRSQLEMYQQEHLNTYPPAAVSADFKNQMLQKTDQNTTLDLTAGQFGPYLSGDDLPINPFNNSTTTAILTGSTEPTGPTGSADGWQYNPKYGWFYPNNAEYFQSTGSFANAN